MVHATKSEQIWLKSPDCQPGNPFRLPYSLLRQIAEPLNLAFRASNENGPATHFFAKLQNLEKQGNYDASVKSSENLLRQECNKLCNTPLSKQLQPDPPAPRSGSHNHGTRAAIPDYLTIECFCPSHSRKGAYEINTHLRQRRRHPAPTTWAVIQEQNTGTSHNLVNFEIPFLVHSCSPASCRRVPASSSPHPVFQTTKG